MSLLGGPAEQNLAVLPGIPGLLGGDLHEGEVAMIDDAFVFDCVAHVFNFDPKNAFGNAGLMFDNHLYAFHNALTPDDHPKLPPEEFLRQWTPSDIRKMVYEESDTDIGQQVISRYRGKRIRKSVDPAAYN